MFNPDVASFAAKVPFFITAVYLAIVATLTPFIVFNPIANPLLSRIAIPCAVRIKLVETLPAASCTDDPPGVKPAAMGIVPENTIKSVPVFAKLSLIDACVIVSGVTDEAVTVIGTLPFVVPA